MSKETRRVLVQIGLFITTCITTTIAGAEWSSGHSIFLPGYTWSHFASGLSFSVPMLLILTVHEFGHYFVAMYHRVKTSLPYYIPVPPLPVYPPISLGTFGAVIRLRSRPQNSMQSFDIGIAGPLAGFVIAIGFLIYGFATLPTVDYIFGIHPQYQEFGVDYADHVYSHEYVRKQMAADTIRSQVADVVIGNNLLFVFAGSFVEPSRIPNGHELMHYPLLMGVFFALFITSLNLLPIGQLDGGHATYGLFGHKRHKVIASTFFIAIVFFGGLGNPWVNLTIRSWDLLVNTLIYIAFLYFTLTALRFSARDTLMTTLVIVALQFVTMYLFPAVEGWIGWLLLALLIGRFVGVQHPGSEIEVPLDQKRVVLGWITLIVFILCFSPIPISAELISE